MNNQVRSEYWKWQLLIIILVAVVVRLVFYSGVYGSDDITYNQSAFLMFSGVINNSTYIGALRYGVIIPVGLSFWAFGVSELSANIWPMFCSLLELLLAFLIAKRLFSLNIALLSALILAVLPVHAHYSGRMIADPSLTVFVALAFYFFIVAEQTNSRVKYFVSGVFLGLTYWVKSVATPLFVAVFLFYAVAKLKVNWLFFIAGGALVWLAHFLFMWGYHGDPFYHLNIIINLLGIENRNTNGNGPLFYLTTVFIDIKYLGLIGIFAVYGLVTSIKNLKAEQSLLSLWLILLFVFLSCLSLRQTNYLLLFAVPLCIYAAVGVSQIKWKKLRLFTIFICVFFSIVLLALKQQDVRNHVANSKALYYFALKHKDEKIYASQKGANIYSAISLLEQKRVVKSNIVVLDQDTIIEPNSFISYDRQTLEKSVWVKAQAHIMSNGWCMQAIEPLEPMGFGNGLVVLRIIKNLALTISPESLAIKISKKLEPYESPQKMDIYKVEAQCNEPKTSS